MASLVLRCVLLIAFVHGNLQLVSWYHHQTNSQNDPFRSEIFSPWFSRNTSTKLRESELRKCQNAPSDALMSPIEDTQLPVHVWVPEEIELLKASFVVINALTILDLVLSRRTKPLRFFLRILYRMSRSNFKWIVACVVCHLWFQCGGGRLTDEIIGGAAAKLPGLSSVGAQMQQAWTALLSYPILSTLTFIIYNIMAGWILHWLMPHNNIRRESVQQRAASAEGSVDPHGRSSRTQSRWSLLVECLFRPVSFATAHNLTDFDFELDDSMELLIERLALPNLWLTPVVPTDYLKYLPVWQFHGWNSDQLEQAATFDPSDVSSCITERPPSCMIPSSECAICLDKYRCSVKVCGLPCGHHFHHGCISTWLQRDNHHCPICRWPAYRNKCPSSI